MISKQLPLKLAPLREDRLDDFVVGPNAAVLAAIYHLLDETAASLFLEGTPGSGKSHLLNALCHLAREQGMSAFYIPLKRLPESAAASLEGLEGLDLVCVDDVDVIAGQSSWEHALFHCFNRIREGGGRLLVSSSQPLKALSFGLPDLASRLSWGTRQILQSLSDEDKGKVMQQYAATQGIQLSQEVIEYLLKRDQRDLKTLITVLNQLQQAAFADKRKITVPLARQVLLAATEK